ncbi:hypothetical protein ACFR97_00030 [Haloplanus litoreus]|uniref:Lipoprotein n=1 Tax=Haloplanus litoreus TaxID=767515 RepID=A0ABD5ZVG2_9EURY
MTSRRALTLLVVVLTVTAGCLGGGGAAVDTAGAADAPATEPGEGAVAGQTDGDDSTPDLTDPEAALREAGSFRVTWQYAGVDTSGVRSEVNHEYAVDLRAERSLTVTSSTRDGRSDGGTSEQFVSDGITYVRSGPSDATTYASYPGTADVVGTAIALSQARAYGADEDLTARGTERFDGVSVTRFELSEASSPLIRAGSVSTAGSSGVVEITDFRYVVLVDANGLSRYESWSFTGRTTEGETVSGEWEYTLTGVGSTTVEDPEWLAAAREAVGR